MNFLGPGSQPSTVVISGTDVSSSVMFAAGGSLQRNLSFTINDDDVALEDIESYQLRFGSTNPSDRVTTGNPTTVGIIDDDRKCNKSIIGVLRIVFVIL